MLIRKIIRLWFCIVYVFSTSLHFGKVWNREKESLQTYIIIYFGNFRCCDELLSHHCALNLLNSTHAHRSKYVCFCIKQNHHNIGCKHDRICECYKYLYPWHSVTPQMHWKQQAKKTSEQRKCYLYTKAISKLPSLSKHK